MTDAGIPISPFAEGRRQRHRRVNVRKTHPTLYHAIMTLSIASVALAVNFWTTNPTFNPFGIPKNLVGCVFFLFGVTQIVFLNVFRDLRLVRISLACSIGWNFIWGLANTQQWFNGNASLQLPILYVALSIVRIPLILEPPVNPMTEKEQ